ncbi:MAG: pantoate--beta-alanine ligase [Acidobacteria bacterium]|nr:pantoate--beta-alanine ligase [Acidobacteriota bacterium]MBV9480381.1 pantoate--beta-alanine ligase [Acidobacteriota bacterium]
MMTSIRLEQTRSASRLARHAGKRIGLVPTMGALHEGHLSLVRAARDRCDLVAVSIFVNPTQFGPNDDFARYPRNLDRDCQLLEQEGVDLVFAPSVTEMYPPGAITFVTVEGMSEKLCGHSRPGHFRGVTTVVTKLFHIVEPDLAFFGQKDAAQVAIIGRLVRDLQMAVEIVVCPIVRDPDGLAMSSRNAYLHPRQRKRALLLFRALDRVQQVFAQGETHAGKLIEAGKQVIAEEPSVQLDYLEIVNPETLDTLEIVSSSALVAGAVVVGTTRLIDNIVLARSG